MNKKQNLIIGLIVIVGFVAYLAWDVWQIHQTIKYVNSLAPAINLSQSVKNDKLKAQVIARLSDMKDYKFGQWPLGQIVLSSQRGNPFVAK